MPTLSGPGAVQPARTAANATTVKPVRTAATATTVRPVKAAATATTVKPVKPVKAVKAAATATTVKPVKPVKAAATARTARPQQAAHLRRRTARAYVGIKRGANVDRPPRATLAKPHADRHTPPVTGLRFPKDAAAVLRESKTVLIIAPKAAIGPKLLPRVLDTELRNLLVDLAQDIKPGDLGALGSTLTSRSPRRLLLGVLPEKVSRYNSEARPESIQRLVTAAGLTKDKSGKAGIILVLGHKAHLLPALNAVARALPLFNRQGSEREPAEIAIAAASVRGEALPFSPSVRETVEAARQAARLVDTPPSELDPQALVEEARKLLAGLRSVKIEEIAGPVLVEEKLGGVYSVGKAAQAAPRVLIASYKPPKAKGPHIALVGKGITFDTGGLHLKARGMMETMKSDMGGAAAVLGAFKTLVGERTPRRISLVLCIAENAIGPGSYKPDDILTLHSGKTVEINNTDAEGRLLLSDGVSYAARNLKADVIIDAATLTGAQLIATGLMHAAVISNDARLEQLLVDAGYASGDLVHPLPFAPEFYQSEFKSNVADMKNSVKNRNNAQSSCAAQFIYSHLDGTSARWGHIDLAGPAFRNERGTGFGVALIAEAVRRLR
ncbi:MAG: leucyl aminopeptidase family protein [Deltaproteobacteria bacterium]|nr:leucyl aminopeptidase family protein [Deltaproteobacteria bacterium]